MSESFKGLDELKVGGQPHYVHGTDGSPCTCGARLVSSAKSHKASASPERPAAPLSSPTRLTASSTLSFLAIIRTFLHARLSATPLQCIRSSSGVDGCGILHRASSGRRKHY